jgi:hypothetical protein
MSYIPKSSLVSGNFGYYNSPKAPSSPVTSVSSSSSLYPKKTAPTTNSSPPSNASSSRPRMRKPKKESKDSSSFSSTLDVFRILGSTLSQTVNSMVCPDLPCEDEFTEDMLFSPTRDPPQAYNMPSSSNTSSNSKPIIDKEDFDLIGIDLQVREYLSSKITKVSQLQNDLMNVLKVLKSDTADATQKVFAREQSVILRRSIKDLESRLQELRNSYLGVCREHLDVRIQKKRVYRPLICGVCGCNNMKVNIDDDSLYVCSECYAEEEILIDAPSFKDTDRVNLTSKFAYTRKGHFIDATKRVQGTQNVDPKKIERALDIINIEMQHHNLVAERGKVNSVSKDNIHTFLTEQSLSAHYEDLFLLYSMITGVPCIDISEYMDDLLADFELLEETLEKIKDESRVNSLNVYFKLCALIQRRGFK